MTHPMKFLPGNVIHHPGCPTDTLGAGTTIYAVLARDHNMPSYQLAQLNNHPTPDNDDLPIEWMSGINVDESWAIWDPFSEVTGELTIARVQLDDAHQRISAIRLEHRADVDRLTTQRETALQHHRQDIATIAECFHAAATDAGLCQRYDDAVSEVNRKLHVELPLRAQPYRITMEITVDTVMDPSLGEEARSRHAHEVRNQIIQAMAEDNCQIPGNGEAEGTWSVDHLSHDFLDH